MQEVKLIGVFLGMVILFILLFTLAHFLWDFNDIVALMLLFTGLTMEVLGGLQLLDKLLAS